MSRPRTPSAATRDRTAAALVVALAIAGCAADENALALDGPSAKRASPCSTSLDCGFGAICINSRCIPRSSVQLGQVSFEVTPEPESKYVRTQFLDQTQPAGAELALVLPAPAVFWTQALAEGQPIAARVSISSKDRIPGRQREPAIQLAAGGNNELRLVPGSYVIQLEPLTLDAPGWETRFEARRSNVAGIKTFELPTDFATIEGEVQLRTMSQTKVAGVHVRAFADPSGLPSTRAITDADGRFRVVLPRAEATRSYQLVAEPPEQPAWSYARSGLTVDAITGRMVVINLEQTSTSARGRAKIRVLGMGAAGPEPVAGARVTLTASSALEVKVFRAQAVTDREGYLTSDPSRSERELTLLGARYQVEIEPPTSSVFKRTMTSLDLLGLGPNNPADEQIEIAQRTVVLGTISTAQGRALANAQIELEPLDDEHGRLVEARTNDRGELEVRLDPGRYVARIVPDEPFGDDELIPVGLEEIGVPADQPVVQLDPITLPAGSALRGVVRGDDGAALARAEVEVFETIGERSISLGRTITGPMGDFSIVLPAPK